MPNEKEATVAHACSCGTSIVCMAQMGAISTTGVAAGGTMGAMGTATAVSIPFITLGFRAAGLGFLLTLPALIYQVLLFAILAFTVFSSYLSYKSHTRLGPLALGVISSLLIYGSVYLIVSELFYWIGFVLMFFSGIWNYMAIRKRVAQSRVKL